MSAKPDPDKARPVDPTQVHSCTIGPMPLGRCTCGAQVMFRLASIVERCGSKYAIQLIWCTRCHRRITGYVQRI